MTDRQEDPRQLFTPLVWSGFLQKVAALQQQEFDLASDLRNIHQSLYPSFEEELSRFFLQSFYTTLRPDKQPGWDLVRAQQIGAHPALEGMVDQLLQRTGPLIDDYLVDSTEDAVEDGYLTGLWLANASGVDVLGEPGLRGWPDFSALLVAGALGGVLPWDRARQWRLWFRQNTLQTLQGQIVIGGTLEETKTQLGHLWQQYVNHVQGMAGNEVYWGFQVGEGAAFRALAGLIDEVWVTKDDEKVCRTQRPPNFPCAPLHLQRTALRPIKDTHPGCRCSKLPLAIRPDGSVAPVTFEAFLQALR